MLIIITANTAISIQRETYPLAEIPVDNEHCAVTIAD